MGFSKALEIITNKLDGWANWTVNMVPNFILAAAVLVFFYFLAKYGRRLARKILDKKSGAKTIDTLTLNLVYMGLIMVGLIMALNVLHLEQTVSSLLAGVGIVGLAIGFAFQDFFANFISGISMALRKPIEVGDVVETEGHFGVVQKIDLRVTMLRTFQGMDVLIPNRKVYQSAIINFTKTHQLRIDLEVGVAYNSDLEGVREVALEAMNKLPFLIPGKQPEMYYSGFGDSAIMFTIMIWIDYMAPEPGFLKARSEAIIGLKKAFDKHDVVIPFPIRTLDMPPAVKENLKKLTELQLANN